MDIDQFAERMAWTFSSTMPTMPHSYIVKNRLSPDDQKLFEAFVLLIREEGTRALFQYTKNKPPRLYLHHNEHFYWTMGAPIEETIIINRAKDDTCRIENGIMKINAVQRD